MTRQGFSDEFDTLIQSYLNKMPFGEDSSKVNLAFDEYEKSLFLTKSQEELIIALYSGRNLYGAGFEETEELRRYLDNLVVDDEPEVIINSMGKPLSTDGKHTFYQLKDDVWFVTYEAVEVGEGEVCKNSQGESENTTVTLEVVPVRQDEYHRLRKNPFRGANKRRALRLDLSEGIMEIVSKYPITKYYIRYLRRPKPIVLEALPDGLEINGESTPMGCELHEALHQKILEGAVRLAVASRGVKEAKGS